MIIIKNKNNQHIPKTAGMSLRRSFIQSYKEVLFSTNHKPLSFKNWIHDGKYKDFPVYAVLREPVKWYTSWWNYNTSLKRTCALTGVLLECSKNINEFAEHALDLTLFS